MQGTRPLLCLSFLVIIFSHLKPLWSISTDTFIYGGCSQLKYATGTLFQSNLNSVLTSLVNAAGYTLYNNFTSGTSSQDIVYGLYQCRGDLSTVDCERCTEHAVSQLGVLCLGSSGGTIQLQGCYVRYDNVTFLGSQDTAVVLKKCGLPSSYNTDVLSRRDSVLSGLTSGGGPFRIGNSGNVQGMAQCMGDLSGGECSDCVSEAVGRLRSECGSAVSGDMYLGKCYARFMAGGVYSKADNDSSEDEAGKTLAIIIGLLAGVALIIVFLSFVRKVFDGKGGAHFYFPLFFLSQITLYCYGPG